MICAERLTLFDAKLRLIFRMHLPHDERTRIKKGKAIKPALPLIALTHRESKTYACTVCAFPMDSAFKPAALQAATYARPAAITIS